MSEREPEQTPRLAVTCPDCQVERTTDDPNEVVEFYRRHHKVTGHAVEWRRSAVDADADALAATGGDLEAVVRELESDFEDGVPLGVVAAAMDEFGLSVGETLDEVRRRRLTGALYEPRDDHLRAY